MNINKNKVLFILNNLPFDLNDVSCSEWVEDNINWINTIKGCHICFGASKLVIVPEKENFVIKIPIPGHISTEDDAFGDYITNYEEFENARAPLYGTYTNDYCRTEAEYYILAQQDQVAAMFAETIYFGDFDGVPVYLQEKCYTITETEEIDFVSKEEIVNSKKLLKTIPYKEKDTIAYAMRYCSEEDCKDLAYFLYENNINDLSEGNIGFSAIDDRFVLIDYSGFDF